MFQPPLAGGLMQHQQMNQKQAIQNHHYTTHPLHKTHKIVIRQMLLHPNILSIHDCTHIHDWQLCPDGLQDPLVLWVMPETAIIINSILHFTTSGLTRTSFSHAWYNTHWQWHHLEHSCQRFCLHTWHIETDHLGSWRPMESSETPHLRWQHAITRTKTRKKQQHRRMRPHRGARQRKTAATPKSTMGNRTLQT